MGLIKEPKNVDFTVQSEPWTETFEIQKLTYKLLRI